MKIDFNKFDDVKHSPLRVFNRSVFAANLLEDFGPQTVISYYDLFDEEEKKQMILMMALLKRDGYDATAKAVTEGVEFQDE